MASRANNKGRGALSDQVANNIVAAVREGLPRGSAAAAGGIHKRTLQDWLRKGEPDEGGNYPDTVHGDLHRRVRQAEAEWERSLVKHIEEHAKAKKPSSWAAAAFLLERRRPEDWAKHTTSRTELTGAGGGPVELADAKAKLLDGLDRLSK